MMRIQTKLVVAALLLLVPLAAAAYTSPGRPTGFVNDFAHVLSASDRDALEQQLASIEQQTGAQVAIAIVPTIGTDETIEEYAVDLFAEWGIGEKGKDNGLLIVVATEDRQMRIEVGYGLEGVITDLQAAAVVDEMLAPAFRQGDFAGGLRQAVTALGAAIAGDPSALPQNRSRISLNSNVIFFSFFILITLFRGLFVLMARTKSWWLGGVLGAIAAGAIGAFFASLLATGILAVILIPFGLLIDYAVSRAAGKMLGRDHRIWWGGPFSGRGGGGIGGGFGGFGGEGSGGGGASGRW